MRFFQHTKDVRQELKDKKKNEEAKEQEKIKVQKEHEKQGNKDSAAAENLKKQWIQQEAENDKLTIQNFWKEIQKNLKTGESEETRVLVAKKVQK